MVSTIGHVSVDARDACAQSRFWAEVLGFIDVADDPNEPGDEECMILDPHGTDRVLFIEVPDPKQGKNRVHFDLVPTDRTREAEVERVLGLGATAIADRRRPDGSGWVVLADPEGNEFCILAGAGEHATGPS